MLTLRSLKFWKGRTFYLRLRNPGLSILIRWISSSSLKTNIIFAQSNTGNVAFYAQTILEL